MLRRLLRIPASLVVPHPSRRGTGVISRLGSLRKSRQHQARKERAAFTNTSDVRRRQDQRQEEGITCIAAVNAQSCTKTAVDDCLERVLGPSANSTSEFAVLFFEGHRSFEVQEALSSFSSRRPQAPPVIGCSLGDGGERQKEQILRARASSSGLALSSPQLSAALRETMSMPGTFRTPSIVTVLGLSFGGRVEAIPVSADGGSFPSIAGDDSISRIFALPREKQPLFLLFNRCTNPMSELEETFSRLGNLLPGCTRLSAASSSDPSCVVSSFPAEGAQILGVCLLGDISLQEQADLARKTLGAFGVDDVSVTGGVCDELFVPSPPTSAPPTPPRLEYWKPTASAPERDGSEGDDLPGGRRQGVARSAEQEQQQQHCVFMVEDFVFPGMTRRFRIFEPRYRVLVKRCLSEVEPLVILPLSRGGNTVGTAAYVSGLHNVEEDGRCEIEITGISRCHVKTMWMQGESFGLQEAMVEYFGDERRQQANTNSETDVDKDINTMSKDSSGIDDKGKEGTVEQYPRSDPASSSATGSGDQEVPSSCDGDEVARGEDEERESESVETHGGDGGGGGNGVSDDRLAADLPESERLRIQVSAVLQRELFRTRKTGRSPLWPRSAVSEYSPFTASGGSGGSDVGVGDGNIAAAVEPCDVDAEALSYWAAQNVEADVVTKHRWLSSTSTEERLRDVRDVCEAIMSRHRERSGVDGSMLSKPFSTLKDLRPK